MKNLKSFWNDDQGASDIVATLLKIAFIVVPLALLLIVFRDQITEFVTSKWDEMMGAGEGTSTTGTETGG